MPTTPRRPSLVQEARWPQSPRRSSLPHIAARTQPSISFSISFARTEHYSPARPPSRCRPPCRTFPLRARSAMRSSLTQTGPTVPPLSEATPSHYCSSSTSFTPCDADEPVPKSLSSVRDLARTAMASLTLRHAGLSRDASHLATLSARAHNISLIRTTQKASASDLAKARPDSCLCHSAITTFSVKGIREQRSAVLDSIFLATRCTIMSC